MVKGIQSVTVVNMGKFKWPDEKRGHREARE
jgi:hypothetical protein